MLLFPWSHLRCKLESAIKLSNLKKISPTVQWKGFIYFELAKIVSGNFLKMSNFRDETFREFFLKEKLEIPNLFIWRKRKIKVFFNVYFYFCYFHLFIIWSLISKKCRLFFFILNQSSLKIHMKKDRCFALQTNIITSTEFKCHSKQKEKL